jgi:hypothetical protein
MSSWAKVSLTSWISITLQLRRRAPPRGRRILRTGLREGLTRLTYFPLARAIRRRQTLLGALTVISLNRVAYRCWSTCASTVRSSRWWDHKVVKPSDGVSLQERGELVRRRVTGRIQQSQQSLSEPERIITRHKATVAAASRVR